MTDENFEIDRPNLTHDDGEDREVDWEQHLIEMDGPFATVATCYGQAEKLLAEGTLKHERPLIPAVNELRYAGYHILRAIGHQRRSGFETKAEEEIHRASKHCQRAIFDISDSLLLYHYKRINQFKEWFPTVTFGGRVPNYQLHEKLLVEVDKFAVAKRSGDRAQYHEQALNLVDKLRKADDDFYSAREELTKIVDKQRDDRERADALQKQNRRLKISLAVFAGVVLLAATALGVILPKML